MMETEQISHLIADLSHADATQRRAAAEELGDADERALYPLIQTLRDDNPGVQDAAMRSLIHLGGEVTAYMTLPLLREGPYLRNTAMLIIKEIGPPAIPLLRTLFADKDDDIRKFAVDLIGEIKACDYSWDLIRLLETDPNPNVRASAAKVVGILRYREALPALVVALQDDEWVCFSALEALAEFGEEACLEPVGKLLTSPLSALRYAAIETLGKIGSARASGILHAYLPKANDMEKNAIIRSLVQTGLTPAMSGIADSLMGMLKEGEWEERLIAIRGLADIREDRAIPVIIDIAGSLDPSDPIDEERLSAVRQALVSFECVDSVVETLNNPLIKYRGKVIAIQVLKEVGCTGAVPHLVPLLEAMSVHVVLAAIDAVEHLAENEASTILSSLREHPDVEVRDRIRLLLEGSS